MKYLSLVLAGDECREQLAPLADTILDLYAEFKPKQLGHLLLNSPLRELSPGMGRVCNGCGQMYGGCGLYNLPACISFQNMLSRY